MMGKKMLFVSLLSAVSVGVVIIMGGCSHESDDIPTKITTANILIEEAWDDFLAADYGSAVTKFRLMLGRDVTITEGYVGLGWSYTLAGTFDKGRNNFVFAQARPDFAGYDVEVYAGLATNYAASEEDSLAVFYARKALDLDSDWVFRIDDNLTSYDLHVMIAQSYFNNKMYLDAKEKVDFLSPGWSGTFDATAVAEEIMPLEWEVSTDSMNVSFRLPQTGVSSIASSGETAIPVASIPASGINACNCKLEVADVTSSLQTEYWVLTCIEEVKRGGVFEVTGSQSGLLEPFDIDGIAKPGSTMYVSDSFTLKMHFKDVEKTRDRRYPEVGDTFTFATAASGVPFVVDQVKEGNRVFISLDAATTDAKFFKGVDYKIFLEYGYYNDFGNFILNLVEKINSLFE